MSPDPSKIKRDVNLDPEAAEYNIHQLEDEEMQVEEGYEQYNLINDDEIPANDSSTDEDETSDEEDEASNEYTFQNAAPQQEPPVPAIISASAEIESGVWNSPRNQESSIEITSETSQQITQIMSKINLPNAPAWINEISTETLVSRLKNPK